MSRSGLVHTAHTDGKQGLDADSLIAKLRPRLLENQRAKVTGKRVVELTYDRGRVVVTELLTGERIY